LYGGEDGLARRQEASYADRLRALLDSGGGNSSSTSAPTQFVVRPMSTPLHALHMRLGGRYLYVHRGHCEHILFLTDVHLLPALPPPPPRPAAEAVAAAVSASTFPRRVYSSKQKQRVCGVCDVQSAAWVTYGDPLTSHMPFFFCQDCYHMLHYSAPPASFERRQAPELLYAGFMVFPYEHDQL